MAQDISQIISELDAAYNPSRQSINDRINGLQGAESADVAGLQAQQTQAFDDITSGARSRGIGFSGIPIQEQAKYTSSSFLPAVAKVKQQYAANRGSLSDALNSLNQDQYKTAMSLRETQMDRDFRAAEAEKQRQAEAAAQRAQATAANSNWSDFLGGGQGNQPPAQPQANPQDQKLKQAASQDVMNVLRNNNAGQLTRYWQAISNSAKNGNPKDILKVQAIQALAPGLFKQGNLNTAYIANASRQGIKLF
jgi:hypothetical protein